MIRSVLARFHGYLVSNTGDVLAAAFHHSADSLAAAACIHETLDALRSTPGEDPESGSSPDYAAAPYELRMALHSGDAIFRSGDYHSSALQHGLRILLSAHAGQTLCSEASAALLRTSLKPGYRLADLGVYRLGDLPAPERLYLLEHSGSWKPEFRRPKARPGAGDNLPFPFTRFFGREDELNRLIALLRPSRAAEARLEGATPVQSASCGSSAPRRLVTLTGAGGCGKTRLAVEAARRLLDDGGGTVCFVSLADLQEPRFVVQSVLEALGLQVAPAPEPFEQLVNALVGAEALLVLDNAEHLVPQIGATIRTLLERLPELRCLVTSRRALSVYGEHLVSVKPLPAPELQALGSAASAMITPDDLLQFPSVQLFIDRAQAAQPDFQLTRVMAPTVAALCNRLEGIPLALELAASRVQVMAPARILAGLDKQFLAQASRPDDPSLRHRVVRTAFEWSFEHLEPHVRRFFTLLSVFRGGWTVEAAEAVVHYQPNNDPASAPLAWPIQPLEALSQLREFSLVLVEMTDADVRFRVLESLREYAQEHLGTDERERLARWHAVHFLQFLSARVARLHTPEEPAALGQLEADADNIRAALEWAEQAGDRRLCAALALGLGRFLQRSGCQKEAIYRIETGLRAVGAEGATEPQLLGDLLRERASLHLDQFEWDLARRCAERAVESYARSGCPQGRAHATNLLGLAAAGAREFHQARTHLRDALQRFEECAGPVEVALTRCNLGLVESEDQDGDRSAARHHWQQALELYQATAYPRGVAEILTNLGALAQEEGRLEHARRLYEESLHIERQLGHFFGVGRALSNLGEITHLLGESGRAVPLLAAAEFLFDRSGSPYQRYASELMVQAIAQIAAPVDPARLKSQMFRMSMNELVDWALSGPEVRP